jgi:hypothetical protein
VACCSFHWELLELPRMSFNGLPESGALTSKPELGFNAKLLGTGVASPGWRGCAKAGCCTCHWLICMSMDPLSLTVANQTHRKQCARWSRR